MPKPNVFSRALLRERSKIDPVTKCWNWVGMPSQLYPQLCGYGKRSLVSRLICQHLHGGIKPWPEQVAMHECDNPRCVNPAHIKVGTTKQNVQDCIKRGRRTSPSFCKATVEGQARIAAKEKAYYQNKKSA